MSPRQLRFLPILLTALALPLAAATPSLSIKVDNFGYRTTDPKVAIFSANPGAAVQVRDLSDTVVYTVPTDGGTIVSAGADAHSGDTVWQVTFSGFVTPGTYRLYSATLVAQSYDFEIRDDIYNAPGLTALKTYFFQRCGTAHASSYAGASWADASACHTGDAACTAHPGNTNYGTKDLSGGWHDAGDYNKYSWYAATDSVYFLLRAYEDNPGVFSDNQLNIPESGNGVPDILDEVKYELDWLLKMQLPGGAVLDRVHAQDGVYTSASPPSGDTTVRYYKDPTNDSAAAFAASCAIGARVFAAYGNAAYAATLTTAANLTWAWLQPRAVTGGEANTKVLAAAEVFRNDPTQTTAKTYIDGWTGNWATYFFNMDSAETWAAQTYIRTATATAGIVTAMRTAVNSAVNYTFTNDDKYLNGMTDWYYYWGSNRPRQKHGLFLLHARQIGCFGSRTSTQLLNKAEDYLHFFHGRNPLNMVYLTNMSSLGGEHSSYMFYHSWFGPSWSAAYGRPRFLGKPAAIVETAYPYYAGTDNYGVNDNRSATYGPAPGFIPGGPNAGYSGGSTPPAGIAYRNKAYRDWAWQETGSANSWEITENSLSSQGPYVALASYFMAASAVNTPTPTPTLSPVLSATPSPTASPTGCIVPVNMAETLTENGTWSGANATRLTISAASAPVGAVTQGGAALRVSVTTGNTWNDAIMNLAGFSPNILAGATYFTVDVYVSASLAGSAYSSLFLYGDCGTCGGGGKYYQQMAAGVPLVAGANTVRFALDYSSGTLLTTDPLSRILLIHNREFAATGSFYLDNLRLEGACWTPTPTRTASATHSPTRTATPSFSPTPTHSPTRTHTPLANTDTPSPTPSDSPTATLTYSAGPSPTDTPVFSPTETPLLSPTPTATLSSSPVSSPSLTPSVTTGPPTDTPTQTPIVPTETFSATATPVLVTETFSLTATRTTTPTLTQTPLSGAPATATSVTDGPLVIRELQAFPQPDPRELRLYLEGSADQLCLKIYTTAWVCVAQHCQGANGVGWQSLSLPPAWPALGPGLYYAWVQAERGSVQSPSRKAVLFKVH